MAMAYSMSYNSALYKDLYRQTRSAIRQLAHSSDAPIACFTLKHVFRKAAELDASKNPEKHLEAFEDLAQLLQGLRDKFCSVERAWRRRRGRRREE
jgi:predicted kinase